MTNFFSRTITGAIFVIVLITAILIHPLTLFLLFGAIVILGMSEFYTIVAKGNIIPQYYTGLCGGLVIYVSSCLYATGYANSDVFFLIIPIIICVLLFELYNNKEHPFLNISVTITGIIYIAVPFSLLVLAGFPVHTIYSYSPQIILGLFILFWSSDTCAYLVGITLGKHPLFKRISPKKSWEGFIGGTILTILIAVVISHFFRDLQPVNWIIISLIVPVFGVWGDLIESMLKRSYGIKDSGNILPGHGGILDRFDAVIFAIPIVFIYLRIFVR